MLIDRCDLEVTVSRRGYLATVTVDRGSVFEQVVRDADDVEVHVAAFPASSLGAAARDGDKLGDYASAMLSTILREQGL